MLRVTALLLTLFYACCYGANEKTPNTIQLHHPDYYRIDEDLTILEKPCTIMRRGHVRYIPGSVLQVCSNGQWVPYNPLSRLRSGLVGHWKMDEQKGNAVDDDSGHENHATASGGPVSARGKFTQGRYFNSAGVITVPHSPSIDFGQTSFSVSGWIKIEDVSYPRTTFAVRKGYGCSFRPGRKDWVPGWEIAHGYNVSGIAVCMRDHTNNSIGNLIVTHDDGYMPHQLVEKWAHYVYAFDRSAKRIRIYVNGKKQSTQVDISKITGSVANSKNLEIGKVDGWKTKGTLDEYRLYNFALNDGEAKQLYLDHRV